MFRTSSCWYCYNMCCVNELFVGSILPLAETSCCNEGTPNKGVMTVSHS